MSGTDLYSGDVISALRNSVETQKKKRKWEKRLPLLFENDWINNILLLLLLLKLPVEDPVLWASWWPPGPNVHFDVQISAPQRGRAFKSHTLLYKMHDCAMRTRAENAQKENPKTFALKLLISKVALQKITLTSSECKAVCNLEHSL